MYIYFMRNKDYLGKILPTERNMAVYSTERKYDKLIVSVDNVLPETRHNVAQFIEVTELDKYDAYMSDLAVTLGAQFVMKED